MKKYIFLAISFLLATSCATDPAALQAKNISDASLQAARDFEAMVCESEKYSAYFSQSPCKVEDITFMYSSKTNYINEAAMENFLELSNIIDAYWDYLIALNSGLLSAGGEWGEFASSMQNTMYNMKAEYFLAREALYKKEITWGEYNQKRITIFNRNYNGLLTDVNDATARRAAEEAAQSYSTAPSFRTNTNQSVSTAQNVTINVMQETQPDYFRSARETFARQREQLISSGSLTPITDDYRFRQVLQRDEERAARDACRQRAIQPIGGC